MALAGLYAPQARADVLAFATNVFPQTFTLAGPIAVDLDPVAAGKNWLAFNTNAAGLVEITFSAECSVSGTGSDDYGSIQILVSNAPVGGFSPIVPTAGPDDAFCSNTSGRITASMTVVTQVPAGAHRVMVNAQAVNGAPQFHLDDLSITVDN